MGSYWAVFKEAFWKWRSDKASRLAASLAYYTLMSLAPLAVIMVAIAGLALGEKAAEGQIARQIQGTIGPAGATVLQDILKKAHRPEAGIVASAVGLGILLISASAVFTELQDALNTIWEVPERPWRGIAAFVKERLMPFGMILGIGFLIFVSLLLSATVEAVTRYVGSALPIPAIVLHAVNFGVSFAVVTLLFAMIYDVLPDVRVPWSDVWTGAAVTSLLFTIGKTLIGVYLGSASVGSAYGAAGSLVVFLVWVYYSAQIFYFGAEFTRAYSNRRGSRAAAPKVFRGGA